MDGQKSRDALDRKADRLLQREYDSLHARAESHTLGVKCMP
jgi:hypothetical protein